MQSVIALSKFISPRKVSLSKYQVSQSKVIITVIKFKKIVIVNWILAILEDLKNFNLIWREKPENLTKNMFCGFDSALSKIEN